MASTLVRPRRTGPTRPRRRGWRPAPTGSPSPATASSSTRATTHCPARHQGRGRRPVVRPPEPVALLLAELAAQSPPSGWATNSPRHWLFPGTRPGQHISSATLARRLAAHHIPIRPARTTALVQLSEDLPPAVLAPLLGLHAVTAEHWRRRAATDGTAYVEARMSTRGGGAPVLAVVNREAPPTTG
ncbi:hypothetical protein ABT218_35335 [Streptomyces sp. NPDC001455]|uniref:hypothetical protein n=1 Tax=Streptomyces sp. NPDC001455 TaxID=3154518 RepID=UPI0033291F0A